MSELRYSVCAVLFLFSFSVFSTELLDEYSNKHPWLKDDLSDYELKGYQLNMSGVWEDDFPKEAEKQRVECNKSFKDSDCEILMNAFRIGYFGKK